MLYFNAVFTHKHTFCILVTSLDLEHAATELSATEAVAKTPTPPAAYVSWHLHLVNAWQVVTSSRRFSFIPIFLPSPVRMALYFQMAYYCLCPDTSCLVGSPLRILSECSLGRRGYGSCSEGSIHRKSFVWKYLFSRSYAQKSYNNYN